MPPDTVDAGAAAPASETAIAAPADTTVTTADAGAAPAGTEAPAKPDIDADLRKVWDKLNPARDNGRFAKRVGDGKEAAPATEGAVETAAAEGVTEQPKSPDQPKEGEGVETAKPSIEAPNSWSAEAKAKWASVPPELQAVIAKRETEAHQAITRAGEQIKAFEPISKVVEQFSETFQRNNLAPADGIARMLAVENWLGKDPGAAIVEIAKAYGVDLHRLTGQSPAAASTEGAQGTEGAVPPIVSTLQAQLAETRAELGKVTSYLTAQQRSQIEGEKTALARQIADFAKDKPHFETVRKHMAGLMQSGAAETMEQAYEMATYALPETRNRILEDQRKADEKKRTDEAASRTAQAKKSASVNVKSGSGQGVRPKTVDDTLREVAAKAYATP